MKDKIDNEFVMSKLQKINDPELNRSIVDLGMVERIELDKGRLFVKIKLTIAGCPLKNRIQKDVENAFSDVPASSKETIPFGAAEVCRGASNTRKTANRIRVPAKNAKKSGFREFEGMFCRGCFIISFPSCLCHCEEPRSGDAAISCSQVT